MFESCEREFQKQQEFLEDRYKELCDSLEKNQELLKNVEAGTAELDPSESIGLLKNSIESQIRRKDLLEVRLGMMAPRDQREAEHQEGMKNVKEGTAQLAANFREMHSNVSQVLAKKVDRLAEIEAGTAELDPSETIEDLRDEISTLTEMVAKMAAD